MSNLFKILILCVIIFVAWGMSVLQKPNNAMRELLIGSTYNELVSIAGNPNYITDGTIDVNPSFKKAKSQIVSGCVKEAWYSNPLRVIPSKYSFCFDKNDKMIFKYHWSSW